MCGQGTGVVECVWTRHWCSRVCVDKALVKWSVCGQGTGEVECVDKALVKWSVWTRHW